MNWDTYITDLNIPDNWECTNFHHDELPSFEINGYKVWVDSHDVKERAINSKRIMGYDDKLMSRFIVENDIQEQIFETNDFSKLLYFVTNSINMNEDDLRQWFGNRGIELEDTKLTYKVVEKQGNRWLFILDDCFEYEGSNEVESYFLGTSYCECYDSWNAKAFNWELENLLSLIDDHDRESE